MSIVTVLIRSERDGCQFYHHEIETVTCKTAGRIEVNREIKTQVSVARQCELSRVGP